MSNTRASRRSARWSTRWMWTAISLAVVVAACTANPGVEVTDVVDDPDAGEPSDSTGTSEQDTIPATDPEAQQVDGSTPIVEPDSDGLPSVAEPDPTVVIGELDNGLRYVIRENDSPGGRVEMRLAVDAGSVLQSDEQDGGAHFLEHMLFNGTEEFPENELVAVLRSFGAGFGADINAYTDYDETVYELTMPSDDAEVVETGLDVLEQWLSAATIEQAQVEAERGVVLDEWRGSGAGSSGRIFDALEELLLAGTPYDGRDPIGSEESITSMDSEPLRAFYDDWYRPDNAAVVVVGDVDADDIEQGIVDRFGSVTDRGSSPERPDLVVDPPADPGVEIHADPDVAEGFASVALPLPTDPTSAENGDGPEVGLQADLLEGLAFDIIATRLGNDALRGEAPFDDARVGSVEVVRDMDAPAIEVSADGVDLAAATQAVFDEFERARRHGFSAAEVDRAVSSVRSRAQARYDGRMSRQDADYATDYVRYALEGDPIPTAGREFEFVEAVLDRATPETIAYGFVERLAASAPQTLVVVPSSEAGDVPSEQAFVDQAGSMRDRDVEPRDDDAGIDGDLMTPPDPVAETSVDTLSDGRAVSFVEPLLLTFDNGVRVSLNVTDIAEGNIAFDARSPGGLAMVDDADVAAGQAAGSVVGASGVATYDAVTLDSFLADKEVGLQASIEVYTEELSGFAATDDLEILLQLVHLVMTQPRVDPVALEQYLDDELAYAADPSIDPGYAEFVTLLDARYDDPRFLLPTVDTLNGVTQEGVERVFRDRFGDASDFTFALSGDFDLDTAIELSRRYLGTLPSNGRSEEVDFVEPAVPPGIVTEQTTAGDGEQSAVTFLFTAPATPDRRDDVAALIVQEVLTSRLTDTIREELGESYSPFSVVQLTGGATPNAEVYISNTTGPDLVDDVAAAVLEQVDDLRVNGPTDVEFASAVEGVGQELDLYSNPQINDEALGVLVDPAGNASFDDFLEQVFTVRDLDRDEIQRYIQAWMPTDQYIEVRVLPR